MLYLGSAAWMLFIAALSDWPRIRDHALTLGLGLGAMLAALLVAVPAEGTALATMFSGFGSRGLWNALLVTQLAWVAAAVFGLAGYSLSRFGRRLRSARAAVFGRNQAVRKPAGSGITGSLAICRATMRIRSWNWAARSVVHGRPESATTRSAASLDAK